MSTPAESLTEEMRIKLLAKLLLSEPWTLVACGLGHIKGEELAKQLLQMRGTRK